MCGAPTGSSTESRNVSVMIMAGPALVHMIKPTNKNNFNQYVPKHFMPFPQSQLTETVTRLDVCWDTYLEGSLKVQTQAWRCSGP